MEPAFLSLSEVLEIHQDQITRYGGSAEIRDLNLLKSALGMPQSTFGGEFLHADLFEMAAAYLFHIVMNHPFVDGNKRTGTVAALVFLDLNGLEMTASQDVLADMVLGVAEGRIGKEPLAAFMRKWSRM